MLQCEITGIKTGQLCLWVVLCFLLHKTEKKVKCYSISDHFVKHLLDHHLGGPGWESTENKYSNVYPARCNVTQFILSGNCPTCFGWCHPKHVEQFPDKIKCVTLHLVGYILE